MTIRLLNETASEAPALLLSHVNNALTKKYVIKDLAKKNSPLHWFSLSSKNSSSMFANIQLGFRQDQIKEMQLEDRLGHLTRIQFEQIKMNQTIPQSLFNFKIPRGVDLVDETRR